MSNIFCETSQSVSEWIKSNLPFFESLKGLPDIGCVYFVYNETTDTFVYVGETISLRQRWGNHDLKRLFGKNESQKYLLYYKDKQEPFFFERRQEEAWFISALLPRLNQTVKTNLFGVGRRFETFELDYRVGL